MIRIALVCLAAILLALWLTMPQSASSFVTPPPTPTNEPVVMPAPMRPESPVQKHKDKHSEEEVQVQPAKATFESVNWQALGFIVGP